jgi:hypothetical protein
MAMRLETVQIERSAQVWVCDTCGGKDHKSCSCKSTASWEAIVNKVAADKERDRQRKRKERKDKRVAEGNLSTDTDVENIEEFERDKAECIALAQRAGIMPPEEDDLDHYVPSPAHRREEIARGVELGITDPANLRRRAARAAVRESAIDRENDRAKLLLNCATAAQIARQELSYQGPLDDEIRRACRQTADAWGALAAKLENCADA